MVIKINKHKKFVVVQGTLGLEAEKTIGECLEAVCLTKNSYQKFVKKNLKKLFPSSVVKTPIRRKCPEDMMKQIHVANIHKRYWVLLVTRQMHINTIMNYYCIHIRMAKTQNSHSTIQRKGCEETGSTSVMSEIVKWYDRYRRLFKVSFTKQHWSAWWRHT